MEQFRQAILEAGLILQGSPIMDGKLHRVAVEGALGKGNTSGAYLGHLDDTPTGYIRNYKTDQEIHWRSSAPTRPLSAAERQSIRRRADAQRVAKERQRQQTEGRVALWAERKWSEAAPVESHSYLERKGIQPHGLRRNDSGALLVPMQDAAGKIWSLQSIHPDGEKHYTKGGRKQGLYCPLGQMEDGRPFAIAEGVATAATVREATGLPVAIAFDSSNIGPVAEALHAQFPEGPIVIAGDNDHHLPKQVRNGGTPPRNVGKEKAEQAAAVVDGFVLLPQFAEGDRGTDWNDFAAQHGIDRTRDVWAHALDGIGLNQQLMTQEGGTMTEELVLQAYRASQAEWDSLHLERIGANLQSELVGPVVVQTAFFSREETGIYQLVSNGEGTGYVLPERGLVLTAEHFQTELFAEMFSGISAEEGPTALHVSKAALVQQRRDEAWIVLEKGEVGQARDHVVAYGTESLSEIVSLSKAADGREAANQACNDAIERLNALPGDSAEKQVLLGKTFKSLLAENPDIDLVEAWQTAASVVESRVLGQDLQNGAGQASDAVHEAPQEDVVIVDQAMEQEFAEEVQQVAPNLGAGSDQLPVREKLSREQVEQALVEGLSLKDKDLSGLDLSGLVFQKVDISGSDLSSTIIRNATFESCFALATDFSAAKLEGCTIHNNNAAASCWNGAHIEDSSMRGNNFAHATLQDAVFSGIVRQSEISQPTVYAVPNQARTVAAQEYTAATSQPVAVKDRQELPDSITLMDSLRQDWSAIRNRVASLFHAPEEQFFRRQNTERIQALHQAMTAAGWDGVKDSPSCQPSQDVVEARLNTLVKSGRYSADDIHAGAPLFKEIQTRLTREKTNFRPEISGNNFQHADLTGAQFADVDIGDNDFRNAVLRGVAFPKQAQVLNDFEVTTQLERDTKEQQRDPAKNAAVRSVGVFDDSIPLRDREAVARKLDQEVNRVLDRNSGAASSITEAQAYEQAAKTILTEQEPPKQTRDIDTSPGASRPKPRQRSGR